MFTTIYSFELKYWLKNWVTYLFMFLFFCLTFFSMGSSLGVFGADTAATVVVSADYINSTLSLYYMTIVFFTLIMFLLPMIVGTSIYRDYSSNMYALLYAYPLKKASYILGRFLGSLTIVLLIVICSFLGLVVATWMPGAEQRMVGPWNFLGMLQILVVSVIPNLLIFGALVFASVTITRKQFVGFIVLLVIMILNSFLESMDEVKYGVLKSLGDPFCFYPIEEGTKYWTSVEKNVNLLPITKMFLLNRGLWLLISGAVVLSIYKLFSFSYEAFSFVKFSGKKKSDSHVMKVENGAQLSQGVAVEKDFSFKNKLNTLWYISLFDLKYILRSPVFIIFMLIGVGLSCVVFIFSNMYMGTETYPVTSNIAKSTIGAFSLSIAVLLFLYSGLITNRGYAEKMNELIDTSPFGNAIFVLSRFLTLSLMLFVLYGVMWLTCLGLQIFNHYYEFEINLYFSFFFFNYLYWFAFLALALFVQTILKNTYVGLFVLLLVYMALNQGLRAIGVTDSIFLFNEGVGYQYGNMNGFQSIPIYFLYRFYWVLLAVVLVAGAVLLHKRGHLESILRRVKRIDWKTYRTTAAFLLVALLLFIGIGTWIYLETNVYEEKMTDRMIEERMAEYEKTYKKYEKMLQPRIVSSHITMDIYPDTRTLHVDGAFILVNKSDQPIDTLYVNYNDYEQQFSIGKANRIISRDTINNVNLYLFDEPLQPGDSLGFDFTIDKAPRSLFKSGSPVDKNGTFINNGIFPSFAYSAQGELMYENVREKYGLAKKEQMADPSDMDARQNTYVSNCADWIDFETTVSTSADQIAIAPGYLQKEWTAGDRRYFHYKMDKKILNFYAFNSGRYEVFRDTQDGINLEIYYHKPHTFNLEYMMEAMKDALTYYEKEYTPYQFSQLRIVEFPASGFAQSFANTIPFSENVGFIAHVKEDKENQVNYPYAITAHEIAHQWWAHQVIGANVKGATLMSESTSEYSSLKVLEKKYGKSQMRRFLKDALDKYLFGRAGEKIGEQPLMYNENQQYIHYNKGSLILYALSDYLGEDMFNGILRGYIERYAFQEAPYTTSEEFVNEFRSQMPDSLSYLIKDMFETITLYDNRAIKAEVEAVENGKYKVDMEFVVSKYRSGKFGAQSYSDNKTDSLTYALNEKDTLHSLPLNDYVELGVFADDEPLYLEKVRVRDMLNKVSVIVDKKPTAFGIDPYNKLIDRNSDDNRKGL